jgi:hypothetical protein
MMRASSPTAKEIRAALTGDPTARESIAFVGAWSATRVPLRKAPTNGEQNGGMHRRSALQLARQQADVGIEFRILGASFSIWRTAWITVV